MRSQPRTAGVSQKSSEESAENSRPARRVVRSQLRTAGANQNSSEGQPRTVGSSEESAENSRSSEESAENRRRQTGSSEESTGTRSEQHCTGLKSVSQSVCRGVQPDPIGVQPEQHNACRSVPPELHKAC